MYLFEHMVFSRNFQVVDFTDGIIFQENSLFMSEPGQGVSWTTFSSVFHWGFWVTCGGCFVALIFLFYTIFLFVR